MFRRAPVRIFTLDHAVAFEIARSPSSFYDGVIFVAFHANLTIESARGRTKHFHETFGTIPSGKRLLASFADSNAFRHIARAVPFSFSDNIFEALVAATRYPRNFIRSAAEMLHVVIMFVTS